MFIETGASFSFRNMCNIMYSNSHKFVKQSLLFGVNGIVQQQCDYNQKTQKFQLQHQRKITQE